MIANTIKLIHEEQLLEKVNHVPSKPDYVIQKKKVVPQYFNKFLLA